MKLFALAGLLLAFANGPVLADDKAPATAGKEETHSCEKGCKKDCSKKDHDHSKCTEKKCGCKHEEGAAHAEHHDDKAKKPEAEKKH